MKVLIITGSRRGIPQSRHDLHLALSEAIRASDLVLHGGAYGVDTLAYELAVGHNVHSAGVNALWQSRDGQGRNKKAGSDRNSVLVELAATLRRGGAEVRFSAFPDAESRGTWDCVRKLKAANIVGEVHQ